MKFEPEIGIPIPERIKSSGYKAGGNFWDFEVLTAYGLSKFYPGKTTKAAYNNLYGFKKKYNGLYKNRTYTVQKWEEVIDGKKVKGVRVWRTDRNSNTPEQAALVNPQLPKRITQTDIHRSLNGSGN